MNHEKYIKSTSFLSSISSSCFSTNIFKHFPSINASPIQFLNFFLIFVYVNQLTLVAAQNKKFRARKYGSNNNGGQSPNSIKVRFANEVIGAFNKDLQIRPLEDLASEDEIGREWLSYGADRINTPSSKKYAQILNMIMPYQEWKSFGKFYQYGCYCFPEGQNLAIGRGEPVDAIDAACKRWLNCYTCASLDSNLNECNAEIEPYSFEATKDPNTKEAKVKCVASGPHGTCQRAVCECDADFVETLARLEAAGKYDITKHRQWGLFDPDSQCMKPKKNKAEKEKQQDQPPVILKTALGGSKDHAQNSIKQQMEDPEKSSHSHGIIDSCCVLQYPNFQLFRSESQKCCYTELKGRYETNVYHPGWGDEPTYECCLDGSVARVSNGGCERKQHNDL